MQSQSASCREIVEVSDYSEQPIEGYAYTVERRNANPGSGTTKNWFHQRYGIPAYTYEVGDKTAKAETQDAARELARSLKDALPTLAK